MQAPSASEARRIAHKIITELPPPLGSWWRQDPILESSLLYKAKAHPGNSRVLDLPGGSFYPTNNTFRKETHILKVFLAKPGNS